MTSPLYLVTVVHNRREISAAFAAAVARQTMSDLVLVMVDDGSTDGTAEAVKALLPTAVVLRGNGNLWWAGGLQKALNWLGARGLSPDAAVAFMNDDTGFDDDFFERATRELRHLPPGNFMVVPGVFYPSLTRSEEAIVCDWPRFRYRDYGRHPERIDCSSTRSLFMRWQDLRRVGGFHPTTLPHYLSDYEFTIRARRRGIRLVPAVSVTARFSDLTTGDHWKKESRGTLADKLKRLFSPRFSANPLYLFAYIWYSAPLLWKIPSWVRVLISTAKFLR